MKNLLLLIKEELNVDLEVKVGKSINQNTTKNKSTLINKNGTKC